MISKQILNSHIAPMLRNVTSIAVQLAVLLGIIGALAYLATPLMQIDTSVAKSSRLPIVELSVSTVEQANRFSLLPDKVRVDQITTELPYLVFVLSILGWIALQIVALRQNSLASLLIATAISTLAGAAISAYGISGQVWAIVSGVCGMAGLCMAFLERQSIHATRVAIVRRSPDRTQFVTWIWSIWVLLTFIGIFWLMDIGARGPYKLMYVGLHQLDAMWLAGLVIMPAMTWLQPIALQWLLTLRQAWNSPRGPWILSAAMILLMTLAVWLGRYAQFGSQRGYPHITAELVRLLTGLSFAWILSRYAEWGGSKHRSVKAGVMLASLLGVAVFTLLLVGDLGPVLAISVALVPGVLMVFFLTGGGRKFILSLVGVAIAWVAFLWTIRFALVEWLPNQDWVPQRLVDRLEAMLKPFAAYLDYGSQIRWLWEAAGSNGFGLGGAPWCGASAHMHLSACTPYSGVPVQFASDYVFSATVALWGPWMAVALVAITAIYFITIGAAGLSAATTAIGSQRSTQLLHRWICAVFAALAIGQLLVSVAGNTFLIPLSGVTQPLLGLGSTSVIALAAWIGFALGGYIPTPKKGLSSEIFVKQWIGRYATTMAVGVAVIVVGLMIWSAQDNNKVLDRLASERLEIGLNVLACASPSENQLQHCLRIGLGLSKISDKNKSEACKVIGAKKDLAIAKWQATNNFPVQDIKLSCEHAESALLALRWLKGRSQAVVQSLMSALPEEIQSRIAIGNPYRLSGCIYLDGPIHNGIHADGKNQMLCPGGFADVRSAIAQTSVLSQTLSAYTSKIRSDSTSQQDSHSSKLIFRPSYKSLSELNSPMWAHGLGLDAILFNLRGSAMPPETSLGQGKALRLGVQDVAQHDVQSVNECYIGKGCQDNPLLNPAGGAMLESARARMAGTIVVNAKTGVIEAAASSYTPCYQAQNSGRIDVNCINLPEAPQAKDWMLTNRALYAHFMTGSMTKVPMALGLIRSRSPLTLSDASLDSALSHSETEKFIDDTLCADQAFRPECISSRVGSLIEASHTLGWNSYCMPNHKGCGNLNLLAPVVGLTHSVPATKWLTDPQDRQQSLLERYPPGGKQFQTDSITACYAKNSPKRWRHCKGQGLVATVAELFGQGNATSTPVGIATGMLNLVQLAQDGTSAVALTPVLTAKSASDADAINKLSKTEDKLAANRILNALSKTVHPGGTAHLACLKALAETSNTKGDGAEVTVPTLANIKNAQIDCGQGGGSQWVIASKTGTPLFPHDQHTYRQRLQHCNLVAAMHDGQAKQYEWTRCQVAPVKWFAAVLGKKEGKKTDWQKIIVVIAERNWNAKTGMVDTPFDRGGNVAAEIGISTARVLIH